METENPSKTSGPPLRHILFSFALVLIVSVALIGGLVVVATNSQNQIATKDSVHLTRSVLAAIERRLADQMLDYSYWDQAVQNLGAEINLEWADNNVGIYMHDKFGITTSFVLDAANRPVYGMIDGERRTANPLRYFSGGLDRLIERARAHPPTKPPLPETGLLSDGKTIHIAAVSVLTDYLVDTEPERRIATGRVLVFTRALDEAMIATIGSDYLLHDLRLTPPTETAGAAAVTLAGVDGTDFGFLTWQVESPARDMLAWLLPLIGAVFLIFTGTAYFFVRKTQAITDTLVQQIDEIQTAQEALRASETRYRNFAADVAHELRTPLAVLRSQMDTFEDQQGKEGLIRDIDRMSRLVSQLLATTHLDWVAIDPLDRADLKNVATGVAAQLAPIAIKENKSIEVIGVDGPVVVRGNEDSLRQAVRNLVENAIRYSARETTVSVEITDEPAIRVLDRGRGIPSDKIDFVFQRFQRADRRGGGAGLGLAIVERVAKLHGATVAAGNRPGGGMVFTILFTRESRISEADRGNVIDREVFPSGGNRRR